MSKKNIFKLALCLAVCQAAGAFGSIFTAPAITAWYAGLIKPPFSPPNWIFAPAWIVLYFLMGASLYLIVSAPAGHPQRRAGLIIFVVQLILNAAWSIIFFGLRSPFYAFIEIILLWISIMITMIVFSRIRKSAAYLLSPYLFWVSFAAILNFSIWWLN